ncbi:MAG: hypothetical protein AAF441_18135 [Pseudomonadota bacterium]
MNLILHETQEQYDAEYNRVRAELTAQGTSLNRWLNEQGIDRQMAYRALKGQSISKRSVEVRRKIIVKVLGSKA